jgi:hypothetical protein
VITPRQPLPTHPERFGIASIARLVLVIGLVPASTASAAPVLDRIEATPAEVALTGARARQQLAVSGFAADGSVRDFTARANFSVEPADLARVSAWGVVTPARRGEGVIRVQAGERSTSVSLKVESPDATSPFSYRLDVTAVLSKAGCNMGACHGNLNGKGGFRLSLRGGDPAFDLLSITRDALGRRTDPTDPGSSLIVRKPTGQVPHEGGLRFTPASPEAAALIGWVAAGARDDEATAPRLLGLDIFPRERVVAAPGLGQQLVVTARFDDGSLRDVTQQAAYDVSDPTKVSVTADGRVEARAATETTVAVRYLGGRAVSRLAFLPERPGFAWRSPPVRDAIDRHVFGKLRTLKILPSEPSTDPVLLRRAYLDAIGRLPSPDEARSFLDDRNPDKRALLVRRLVRRPEFADFWALKWADLLRNEEKTMGEKGVWVFQRWLRDAIAADAPLDDLARRLITSKGSTWSNPAASFYRTNRDPMTAAETVGQVFLGVRLQCARCHNHPFDDWTQDDYYGLAAFFGNVRSKEIANVRKDNLDKYEINGDVIIYLSGQPRVLQPRSGEMMAPKPPRAEPPDLHGDPDARDALARWLTVGNRQFARNLANRVWFHLMGRGVVDPVDDFRDSNPPSNPALLDELTDAFLASGYRLRPLVERIMTTQTYQLGPEPNETNADDEANFARASVRLIPAEALMDALGQALGTPGHFTDAPAGLRATQLAGARMGGTFLKAFGKPDRLLTCECERSESTTLAQAFQLINGEAVRSMLEAPDNRLGKLLDTGASDDAILDEMTLAALSRLPTASERSSLLGHVRKAGDRRKLWEDVAWAVVNSKEFLLRH